MKARVKRLWLEALRSGEYVQGQNQLVREQPDVDTEFCCLGVLTNLYVEETGDASAWTRNETLDRSVVRWAGVEDTNPFIADRYASNWNDGGESFASIADLIEKYL